MPKTQVRKNARRVRAKNVRQVKPRVVRESRAKYAIPAAPRPPDPIIATELPRAVKRIANALHPEKIILFGSHAYGTPTWDSDVDLLVIMETQARPVERAVTVGQYLMPRVFPVDIIVKTPGEIESAFATGDFFIKEIYSQGRVLYERSC